MFYRGFGVGAAVLLCLFAAVWGNAEGCFISYGEPLMVRGMRPDKIEKRAAALRENLKKRKAAAKKPAPARPPKTKEKSDENPD